MKVKIHPPDRVNYRGREFIRNKDAPVMIGRRIIGIESPIFVEVDKINMHAVTVQCGEAERLTLCLLSRKRSNISDEGRVWIEYEFYEPVSGISMFQSRLYPEDAIIEFLSRNFGGNPVALLDAILRHLDEFGASPTYSPAPPKEQFVAYFEHEEESA